MKSKYFKIYELVSPAVYKKFGETAWQFFDPRLIVTLDFIKEYFSTSITINNWYWKGNFTQRGLRENISEIVKNKTVKNEIYLSAHILGMAVDFDVKNMTSEKVRLKLNEISELLPYPIRLEKNVGWVHLDVEETEKKVYIF